MDPSTQIVQLSMMSYDVTNVAAQGFFYRPRLIDTVHFHVLNQVTTEPDTYRCPFSIPTLTVAT